MFDLGWSELLLVAVLAIVFIGPKDLPRVMRTLGQYVGKMKAMAREFQNSFEDLARETELDELRKQVADLRNTAMKPLAEPLAEMERAIKNAGIEGRGKASDQASDSDRDGDSETGPTPELPTAKPDPAAPPPSAPAPAKPAPVDDASQDEALQDKGPA